MALTGFFMGLAMGGAAASLYSRSNNSTRYRNGKDIGKDGGKDGGLGRGISEHSSGAADYGSTGLPGGGSTTGLPQDESTSPASRSDDLLSPDAGRGVTSSGKRSSESF